MSYELTFYETSYQGLHGEIVKPSKDFRQNLQEVWQTVYAPSAGESFESALDEGLAELKKALAEKQTDLTIKGELAFVAALETYGQKLGSLVHSSSGGEEFREEFLNETAAKFFNLPRFGEYLTERPLYGFRTLEYPSWGGFLQNELAKIEIVSNPAPTANQDFDEWLAQLVKIIRQAKDSGKDLLTIYK